jgi:DNA-directed RNA polymerase subunit E'/Rpb7
MFLINDAVFTVPVPPAYLQGMEMLAAEEVLDSKLLTYDERFGGLLIGYQSLKFMDKGVGVMQDEQPDVLFRFKAKLLLYCPKKGEIFQATVSDIQAGHITLLMAGVFPVVLRAADYPHGSVLGDSQPKTLIDDEGKIIVSEGDECRLKCIKIVNQYGRLSVEAAFAEPL